MKIGKIFDKVTMKRKGVIDVRQNKENSARIVLQNAYVDICYEACKECYKGKIADSYEARTKYIQDKVKHGHESVTEHSNIVMLMYISKDNLEDLMTMVAYSDHLKYEIDKYDDITYAVLIGGSILGYKQVIRSIPDLTNSALRLIIGCLYELDKSFFYDLINDGVMVEDNFASEPYREAMHPRVSEFDRMAFMNVDEIAELYSNTEGLFPIRKLVKFITVTVHFKSISRVISQQVTRHRNAISQKSQRYVDEENATFASPVQFRDDKTEVMINWAGQDWTSQDLGEFLISVYPEARKAGLRKEEARAYLPNNAETSLFVTFRGGNLIHFIKLRTEPAAQNEIREFANEMERMLIEYGINEIVDDMRTLILPEYKLKDICSDEVYDAIDEIVETE